MRLKNKETLPITKYRKVSVDIRKYQLANGMVVELIDSPHGISSVYASTFIANHDSIVIGEAFLLALEQIKVFDGARINFDKVRSFSNSYHAN